MIRPGPLVTVLAAWWLVLGGVTLDAAAPAVAASGSSSQTVPGQLTTQFPLGPQHLCCQSRSHSATATQPATAAARATGGSSDGAGAVILIALGVAVTALLGAGVIGARRSRRPAVRARSPGTAGVPAVADAVTTPPLMAALAPPTTAPARSATPSASARPLSADESHYSRLDDRGDAGGAFNLGVLLHERGEVARATAAYRRAEERGNPEAGFNLGVLLYETDDFAGAEAAWQRAVERGHARAAANLEFLAQRHGSAVRPVPDGDENPRAGQLPETVDEIAYRRADDRGGAQGAFNLGVVLHQRGDVDGAVAAYGRAERRGDPDAAFNLGVLLYEAGDLDGAEASWRRSIRRGNSRATKNLEFLARRRRERETAGVGRDGGEQ